METWARGKRERPTFEAARMRSGRHGFGTLVASTASVGNIATTWTVQSTHADWRKQAESIWSLVLSWVMGDLVARVRPFSITGEKFGYRKSVDGTPADPRSETILSAAAKLARLQENYSYP
jgi:hypothetical protein